MECCCNFEISGVRGALSPYCIWEDMASPLLVHFQDDPRRIRIYNRKLFLDGDIKAMEIYKLLQKINVIFAGGNSILYINGDILINRTNGYVRNLEKAKVAMKDDYLVLYKKSLNKDFIICNGMFFEPKGNEFVEIGVDAIVLKLKRKQKMKYRKVKGYTFMELAGV